MSDDDLRITDAAQVEKPLASFATRVAYAADGTEEVNLQGKAFSVMVSPPGISLSTAKAKAVMHCSI